MRISVRLPADLQHDLERAQSARRHAWTRSQVIRAALRIGLGAIADCDSPNYALLALTDSSRQGATVWPDVRDRAVAAAARALHPLAVPIHLRGPRQCSCPGPAEDDDPGGA
jgi:Arc/MetJ-type ribon-helix-helix transcriptional regulator